ncbi:hypothetical protein [Pedobacter frigoris]|uniref:Uncharacterized protein n=1 Tax=Pedobacter frigoris TaxID=2571272 RepID=A0A4U1CEY6_9SPHI|nr:hypothetical protein [Pedobacter frigoris]TKC05121.1 hypothetical protein FA047_15275 [Pedobacter frigoris]
MKLYKIFLVAVLAMFVLACKKESPIEDIVGSSNDDHRASLRVTLNNRTPALGDSIVITASTWHVSDQIAKVEFIRTAVEKYAVNLELNNTSLNSWIDDKTPAFLIVDSLHKEEVWRTVDKSDLNRYFETLSDSYVIREAYKEFKQADAKDAALINAISEEGFKSLKDLLSRSINVLDYKALFPAAPAGDISGASLTAAGKENLNKNLTKQLLISNALKTATKKGDLIVTLKVKVTAQKSAVNEVINVFQTKY